MRASGSTCYERILGQHTYSEPKSLRRKEAKLRSCSHSTGSCWALRSRCTNTFEVAKGGSRRAALEQDLAVVQPAMHKLLDTVQLNGPAPLADEARRLIEVSESEINELLLEYWRAPSDVQFFAKAFLQPYARWLAEISAKPVDRDLENGENRCPFCAGKPQLSLLRIQEPDSEVGGRNLLCSTCLTVWPFRRVVLR